MSQLLVKLEERGVNIEPRCLLFKLRLLAQRICTAQGRRRSRRRTQRYRYAKHQRLIIQLLESPNPGSQGPVRSPTRIGQMSTPFLQALFRSKALQIRDLVKICDDGLERYQCRGA